MALYGAEIGTFRKVDHKYLESSEIWSWRNMEMIGWSYSVRNEEVLQRVKEERNIIHTVKRRKANLIGHILRGNCLVKHINEGKIGGRIEVRGRRGRRRKQLPDDIKETTGYFLLKDEALHRTVWRTGFERGSGLV
jgi:hypothetical protein